jgi:molecular chaperone GrpE
MWDKARALAARHLKPAFDNLKIVSTEDTPINPSEVTEAPVGEAAAGEPSETEQLQAQIADLQDRLLRRQAEFENYRRRQDRDRSDFLQYAGMEVVREILPVLDDFERAQKAETTDTSYRQGVELIYQRLVDTLKRIGLEPVESTVGQPFDPNLHQAVVRVETEESPDNSIVDELQRGYNFKGKLLRPAMVRVAVKPAS